MIQRSSSMSISFSTTGTALIVCRIHPAVIPSARFFRNLKTQFNGETHSLRLRPVNCSHTSTHDSSDFDSSPVEKKGNINGNDEKYSPNKVLDRLKRYGISGILSYGLLNTAYYLTTFLVVWFYITPVPGKMGYLVAVKRFVKVLAMVWAGSQVTKIVRAGGALALAPFVDRGLSWFTVKFGFESQGKAFMVIAGVCFGLAFLMFLVVTLLWA